LRSFLDHVFLSPALAEGLKRTIIIDDPIAAVASDHYPVVVEVELPASSE
jgi:endonuclease/exonuclease/phosphatase family metal-dependent hydrolase